MQTSQSILKDKNKRTGLIGTVIFHLLLLLLLFFIGLKEPYPKIEEIGMPMRIRLGTTKTGKDNSPAPEVGSPVNSTPKPVKAASELSNNVATQTQESINITKTEEKEEKREKKEEKIEKEVEKIEEPKVSEHLQSLLNKFKDKSKNAGGSYGNENAEGNQGAENGNPDGGAEGGNLPGGGSYKLAGRGVLSVPKIEDKSQEEGKVVVDIIVDRNGDVIRAIAGGKGSTTTSSILLMKAKEAAQKAKFSPNPNAPAEQYGQMTFVFILK